MGLLLQELALPRDDAARRVLTEAVSRHRAAQADQAATRAAIEAAEQAMSDARRQHDAAEASVAAAAQEAADHAQALARGTAGPAPVSARERREALLDAEDALTAARSARDLLQQRLPADAERVTWAEMTCRKAAVAVMAAECAGTAEELLDELARAQEVVARIGCVIESLSTLGVIEPTAQVRRAVGRHASPPSSWGWQNGLAGTGPDAQWRAALAALMTDPDAPAVAGLRA